MVGKKFISMTKYSAIITTLEMQQAYEPLKNYGVNIFAFDFCGTGKSAGNAKTFSCESIVNDLDSVVTYIESNFSSNVHLYGNGHWWHVCPILCYQ